MTVPSLVAVRESARSLCAAGVPVDSSLGVVCMFIDAALSAPGMTAERLAEIETHYRECGYYDYQELGELLAEVLRLRAELEAQK